jgi:hypothetical protein
VHSTCDGVMAQVKLKSTDERKSVTFYTNRVYLSAKSTYAY